jgi:beta-lactam-binding protein with PASTA domain
MLSRAMAVRILCVCALLLVVGCFYREPRVPAEELRSVPGVVGETVAAARERLETDGFLVRIIPVGGTPPAGEIVEEPPGKCANGEVVEQDPSSEEEVLRAATVVLTANGC